MHGFLCFYWLFQACPLIYFIRLILFLCGVAYWVLTLMHSPRSQIRCVWLCLLVDYTYMFSMNESWNRGDHQTHLIKADYRKRKNGWKYLILSVHHKKNKNKKQNLNAGFLSVSPLIANAVWSARWVNMKMWQLNREKMGNWENGDVVDRVRGKGEREQRGGGKG